MVVAGFRGFCQKPQKPPPFPETPLKKRGFPQRGDQIKDFYGYPPPSYSVFDKGGGRGAQNYGFYWFFVIFD